jgi:RNA polymerase sigma factor (TIGR02999 family)
MPHDQSNQVSQLLHQWAQGDEHAFAELVPIVYTELRRLAHRHLEFERPEHTLQSAALVNEAFLRLLDKQPGKLQNRGHFVAVASRLMRQILVDYARTRGAGKRDGGCRIDIEVLANLPVVDDTQLIGLDDALEALSSIDERQAKIVDMKFFGGLSIPEICAVLGLSHATVERDWSTARVWLHRQMVGP